jgi:catechol 2,3-dioxygenase-like lactoylglutathione lyase family enzyme
MLSTGNYAAEDSKTMSVSLDTDSGVVVTGPPMFLSFSHVSVPCRDLDEAKRFYVEVMGGELVVDFPPQFASVRLCGVDIGFGTAGCSFTTPSNEYPHFAFFVGPGELVRMKHWLTECGIPTSNFWTRSGVEALMFVRDPSGNMIEFYCERGFKDAKDLPHGPARGHGTAVDIDKLYYGNFTVPK